ncbi:MAG TPA: hypothetical protein DHV72_06555 [Serratia grimesii]|jgi:hypothetical protein|uniref:Uncharacterized protein n=1 Tax=Serratia grimesii TaxID=82995 RepID=A0A9C7QUS0_9GAMM|nr:hypothetical protein [Serratia grimesii]
MYSPFIPDAQKFNCFHIGNDADSHTNNGITAFLTLLLHIPAADNRPTPDAQRAEADFCLET